MIFRFVMGNNVVMRERITFRPWVGNVMLGKWFGLQGEHAPKIIGIGIKGHYCGLAMVGKRQADGLDNVGWQKQLKKIMWHK